MSKIKYPYEFDPKKRKLAKKYRKGKLIIYFFNLLLSLAIVLFILFSGLNVDIRNFVIKYPLSTLLYGTIFLLIFTIVKLPVNFYSTYIYEHKFKLSKYKLSSWFKDFLKFNLIYYITTLITISLLYFSIRTFSLWWIFAGILYIIYITFISYISPLVILPFLSKTEPYRDKKMKEKILKLCRKLGVRNIRNIVVVKESEKTVKANAFFMGLGNSKRIGLVDNLLNNFTKPEIETVIGHELGHYVNKDIIRGLILESIIIFLMLFIIDYAVKSFGYIFNIQTISDLASLPLIALIYGILGFLSMPIINTYSRYREAKADEFALQHIRKPVAQISTEKRLADMALSELSIHPLIEFWLFDHPSTIKRIKMAEKWKRKKKDKMKFISFF